MDSGKGVIRLEWDTFQANIAEQYQSLRGAQDFTDVTLVCKDFSKTEAHRVILAAGSTFFNGILGGEQVKSHPHPMIFLPGVTRATLAPLLDFFYSGEASVAQEDLQDFLILSKSLGVKGLIQTEDNTAETEDGELNSSGDQKENRTPSLKKKEYQNLLKLGANSAEQGPKLKEETNVSEEICNEDDLFVTLNGVSTCKVCELRIDNKSELSAHMKEHLEEMQNEDFVSERKKKRKTSKAWKFFTPNDSLSASCSICNVEIKTSGGTTSSLHNHLKGKHKLEYRLIELDDGVVN